MLFFGRRTPGTDPNALSAELESLATRVAKLEAERLDREHELLDIRTKYLSALKRVQTRLDRQNAPPKEDSESVLSLRKRLGR